MTAAERAQAEADVRRQAVRNRVAMRQVQEFKKYRAEHPGGDVHAQMQRAYRNSVTLDYEAYDSNA